MDEWVFCPALVQELTGVLVKAFKVKKVLGVHVLGLKMDVILYVVL